MSTNIEPNNDNNNNGEEELGSTADFRLDKDLREAARTLDKTQARYLVDTYYQIQNERIRANHQIKAIERGDEESGDNPHAVLDWIHSRNGILEGSVKAALEIYAKNHGVGKWAMNQKGVGPVIAAGLLANIDIKRCPTVGHIWSFAGLDPQRTWGKGEKRPWNTRLKTLCAFKLGECFVKVQNRDNAYYGEMFKDRKVKEWTRNLNGGNVEAAGVKVKIVGKDTTAYKWYKGDVSVKWAHDMRLTGASFPVSIPKNALETDVTKRCPMLPPAHVHARARRWVVKMFLSHFFHAYYLWYFGENPPKPFVIEHKGHVHNIIPPDLDMITPGEGGGIGTEPVVPPKKEQKPKKKGKPETEETEETESSGE